MHRLAALRSVGGYVRRAGSGVAALVRRAVMPCVGRYLYQMGRVVLGLVGRAVAFLEFEDGRDAAGYICFSAGLGLMLLGTLAAPDLPALYLWAEYPGGGGGRSGYCAGYLICDPSNLCFVRKEYQGTCDPPETGCSQVVNKDQCGGCRCLTDQTACTCN